MKYFYKKNRPGIVYLGNENHMKYVSLNGEIEIVSKKEATEFINSGWNISKCSNWWSNVYESQIMGEEGCQG
jgi:general stress protein 26